MTIFWEPMAPEMTIVSWFKLQKSSGYSISAWISQGYEEKKNQGYFLLCSVKGKENFSLQVSLRQKEKEKSKTKQNPFS